MITSRQGSAPFLPVSRSLPCIGRRGDRVAVHGSTSHRVGLLWANRALRVAVAGEFLGHGLLAIHGNEAWIPFITLFGFSAEIAPRIMTMVGTLDVALALLVLVRPTRPTLAWMVFWGFFTALLRPLTGHSILAFIERAPNWGAPLALLLLHRSSHR